MAAKRSKVPTSVLERAKAAAVAAAEHEQFPKKAPKTQAPAAPPTARAKVIAALKKLHPMD